MAFLLNRKENRKRVLKKAMFLRHRLFSVNRTQPPIKRTYLQRAFCHIIGLYQGDRRLLSFSRRKRGSFEIMKIVMIHGQSHKGNTYTVAKELADKIGGEIREFFLPRDFDKPCNGCFTCFQKDLTHCPHYKELEPMVTAISEADLLILESPVYVYHATGQMLNFLDHFGTWWVVHRPVEALSQKQAVVIATAAGGGMKSTVKDMADSLEMWGIRKIYKLGIGVQAVKP